MHNPAAEIPVRRPLRHWLRAGLALLALMPLSARAQQPAQAPIDTHIGLIYRPQPAPSSYDAEAAPEDEGLAGAKMGIADNNTTGRFTKQTYTLDDIALTDDKPDPVAAAKELVGKGIRYLVLALPADAVLAVSMR